MSDLGKAAEMRRRTFLGLFAAFGAAAAVGIDLAKVDEVIAEEVASIEPQHSDLWVKYDEEWVGLGRLLSCYYTDEQNFIDVRMDNRDYPPLIGIRSGTMEFEVDGNLEAYAELRRFEEYCQLRVDMCGYRFEIDSALLTQITQRFDAGLTTSGTFHISSEPRMSEIG